jgi:cation-transporting P-type ATPase I
MRAPWIATARSLAVWAAASAARVPVAAAATALSTAPTLLDAAGHAGRLALRVPTVPDQAQALLDLRPRRTRRRVWTNDGEAGIEVRGLTGRGPTHRRLAAGVTRRLRNLRGVRWAEINAVTGQVLVAFDEGRVDFEALLDTVRGVEAAHGTQDDTFSWSKPVHPADATPIAVASIELAADCVSTAVAVAGRVLRLPPAPRGLRVAHALLEVEKPLRRQLKKRIGPIATDAVMALSAAAIHGCRRGRSHRPWTRCTGCRCSARRCPVGRSGTAGRASCAARPGTSRTRRRNARPGRCPGRKARSRSGPTSSVPVHWAPPVRCSR